MKFETLFAVYLSNYAKLAVRKVGHLNIKTKMFEVKARVLIGWLARVFKVKHFYCLPFLRRVYIHTPIFVHF